MQNENVKTYLNVYVMHVQIECGKYMYNVITFRVPK